MCDMSPAVSKPVTIVMIEDEAVMLGLLKRTFDEPSE